MTHELYTQQPRHYRIVVHDQRQEPTEETKILTEILTSKYVHDYISEVLVNIRDNIPIDWIHEKEPYGFGEGCYYRTERALVQNAVDDFLDCDEQDQSPTLTTRIMREVKEQILNEIATFKNMQDCIGSSFGRTVIRPSADYSRILGDASKDMDDLLKKKTDEDIHALIETIRSTLPPKA